MKTGKYFPSPRKLPDSNLPLPCVHIWDIPPIPTRMMRPYSRIESRKDCFKLQSVSGKKNYRKQFRAVKFNFQRILYTNTAIPHETENLCVSLHNLFAIVTWSTLIITISMVINLNRLKIRCHWPRQEDIICQIWGVFDVRDKFITIYFNRPGPRSCSAARSAVYNG